MQHNEVVVENKDKKDSVNLKQELERSPYFVSLEEDLGKSKEMKEHDASNIFISTSSDNEIFSLLDRKR